MKVCGMIAVLLAGLWSVAVAEPMKQFMLDEIVVSESGRNGVGTTVIGEKIIEKGKNINLPDVLKNEPDIDMKRRTAVGDTADIMSIRGFSGNRIMLNIDGRPVNAAGVVGGYYIDWGTIPLDNIQKIQIIRGGSAVQYGNNALGGVVNVITKKPTETPSFTFFGSYGGGSGVDAIQNYRITHTYKVGPIGYSLAGSYQKSAPFLWNNDFEGRNLAATVYADMPLSGEMRLGMQYTNAERGFILQNRWSVDPDDPGFYSRKNPDFPLAFGETFSPYSGTAFTPGPEANWDKTKYYLDFGYSQPLDDGMLELKFYKNHEDRNEKNYSSSLINPAYADGALVLDRKVESDRSYGGSLTFTKPLGAHELLLGAEYKDLSYGDIDINYVDLVYNSYNYGGSLLGTTGGKPSSEGDAQGYFVQDAWSVADNLVLTGGVRYDRYENNSINGSTTPDLNDEALTPKLTGAFMISELDVVTASVYQAVRTPGLPETYWWANGATHGDPVLKPEKNSALEASYRHGLGGSNFIRFSAYRYSVEDYIVFRFDPNWRGVYNIDRAIITGASLDGTFGLASWITGNAAVTWQHSDKEGDVYDTAHLSDEIDYLPEWKANAGVDVKLPGQSALGLTVRYVGERSTLYSYSSGRPPQAHFKLVTLSSYVTADITLRVPVSEHLEFSCYGENLLDEDYEEQFGYPLPGLVAGAAVKVSF